MACHAGEFPGDRFVPAPARAWSLVEETSKSIEPLIAYVVAGKCGVLGPACIGAVGSTVHTCQRAVALPAKALVNVRKLRGKPTPICLTIGATRQSIRGLRGSCSVHHGAL